MKFKERVFGLVFCTCVFTSLWGQENFKTIKWSQLQFQKDGKSLVDPVVVTSFFAISQLDFPSSLSVKINGREIVLKADEHLESMYKNRSNLYIFPSAVQIATIEFETNQIRDLTFFYVPQLKEKFNSIHFYSNCNSPAIVSQSVWRKGLPGPIPGRSKTATRHCVIHHSAGNNTDTNYTEIVRNIYIYHTQSNGWDDIGYNYLIARNGIVFAGRDPEKLGIEQDNVLGAHFCGKNQNTMGVCMLGDFTTDTVSIAGMNSLIQLLKWKVFKDSIHPLLKSKHPDASGIDLGHVAGHRDGCNTTCPGNMLYNKLSWIRNQTMDCNKFILKSVTPSKEIWQLYFAGHNKVIVRGWVQNAHFFFYDLNGKKLAEFKNISGENIELNFQKNTQTAMSILLAVCIEERKNTIVKLVAPIY